jgi:hypothetical protein
MFLGACGAGAAGAQAELALAAPAAENPLAGVLDYGSAFVTFGTKNRGNLARLAIESRCLLFENDQLHQTFYQFASCKSEDTYAKEDLFKSPNWDFSGVFSATHFVIFRVHLPFADNYADRGRVAERFEDLLFQLPSCKAEELRAPERIVAVTLSGKPLVGRTVIQSSAGRRRAVLEYPIKTMNVNDKEQMYQVDTGPLAYPDFSVETENAIERIELAYVAYNRADEAYFIVQRPTPVDGTQKVAHYSQIVRLPAQNSVWAVSR